MIPDFEIKVTPGSYEEVSERFKTYLRFRFGTDPASVFITGATGSGKSTASISLAIQYVKQGIPALAIDINQTMSPEHICKALLHFKHEDFHRTESGAYLIGGCKTEAGRNRIIPILDFGIPVFEHAYATSVENGPLFPNGKGGFWNEKNWRNRKFYPFLEEIGIQPNPYDENGKRKPEFAGKLATYTPYTTRHTYASLCDRAGVNKDILKRAVGHTPKSKTLDEVYLHPKATQMIEAFDKANQLVNDEVLTTTKA